MSLLVSRVSSLHHNGAAPQRKKSLQDLVAGFSGKRVVVLGDVMLDEYIWGEVRRISPEAPVPVVDIKRRTYIPGGAANTAANIVGLGGQARLFSVIGEDYQGTLLRQALGQSGIEADSLCVDPARVTTVKSRIVAHNQQVARLDSQSHADLSPALEAELLSKVETALASADACILSDYAKGVVSSRVASQFIRLARQAGKPIVVDPKGTNYTKYRGATLVKPNLLEAECCTRLEITGEESLLKAAQRLLMTLKTSALLITRGSEGMSLFRRDEPPVHIPAILRKVYDVTGAGDTVASTLAITLAAEGSLEDAIRLANQAASIVVGKVGTTAVTREELLGHMSQP